jgi:hypothetical protein
MSSSATSLCHTPVRYSLTSGADYNKPTSRVNIQKTFFVRSQIDSPNRGRFGSVPRRKHELIRMFHSLVVAAVKTAAVFHPGTPLATFFPSLSLPTPHPSTPAGRASSTVAIS